MTEVRIRRKNGSVTSVECEGHSGYAEEGSDIVCSAVSSLVQTAVLGLFGVAAVNPEFTVDEERGYLGCFLPENMSARARHDSDVILETMILGISDLCTEFSDFVRMEVR